MAWTEKTVPPVGLRVRFLECPFEQVGVVQGPYPHTVREHVHRQGYPGFEGCSSCTCAAPDPFAGWWIVRTVSVHGRTDPSTGGRGAYLIGQQSIQYPGNLEPAAGAYVEPSR